MKSAYKKPPSLAIFEESLLQNKSSDENNLQVYSHLLPEKQSLDKT